MLPRISQALYQSKLKSLDSQYLQRVYDRLVDDNPEVLSFILTAENWIERHGFKEEYVSKMILILMDLLMTQDEADTMNKEWGDAVQ